MTLPAPVLWRVFPWDPEAAHGVRYSPPFTSSIQGKGRFDLPGHPEGVLYLAETADHAVGERIQGFRGQTLGDRDLMMEGHRLAVVSVSLSDAVREEVVDLCDPGELVRHGVRPDDTASRDRRLTQGIAAAIHARGREGLRWWSVFFGEWHTIVLFRDRWAEPPGYGEPEPLSMGHAAVCEAARALGIAVEPSGEVV